MLKLLWNVLYYTLFGPSKPRDNFYILVKEQYEDMRCRIEHAIIIVGDVNEYTFGHDSEPYTTITTLGPFNETTAKQYLQFLLDRR